MLAARRLTDVPVDARSGVTPGVVSRLRSAVRGCSAVFSIWVLAELSITLKQFKAKHEFQTALFPHRSFATVSDLVLLRSPRCAGVFTANSFAHP